MKKILITGATSGIGKATAFFLNKKGYECVLVGRDKAKLEQIVNQLENARFIVYNLNNIQNIGFIFDELKNMDIVLDGIVHCAGVNPQLKVENNDVDVMLETYSVNVFSFIEIMKYLLDTGLFTNGTSVVAISSVTARGASYMQTLYASSKAALESAVRCMAKECIQKNIRVNCIAPGAVKTEMLEKVFREKNVSMDNIKKYYPLGVIELDNIAWMIEGMLSPNTKYMSGSIIEMDAGYWVWK